MVRPKLRGVSESSGRQLLHGCVEKMFGTQVIVLEASFQRKSRAVEIFRKVRFFRTRSISP